MSEQGYNGWSNYETWAMSLWIGNNQGSYNYSREIVEQVRIEIADERDDVQSWGDVVDEQAHEAQRAADAIQAWQEEERYAWEGERPACQFTDLLSAALQEVNWREIAENILSELAEV